MRCSPILAALLPACVFPTAYDTESFEVDEPIGAIDVSTLTGDIEVIGASVDAVRVEADLQWYGEKPDVRWEVDGDTLVVSTHCQHPSWYCDVDLFLEVPRDVDAALDATTGDVLVREIDGDVDIDVTTGDVNAHDVLGAFDARTTTGQVLGRGLLGPRAYAQATTGDIDLAHEDGFDSIDALTTTGDVRILVPGGTYACDADNTTGGIDISGIVDDPAADATITAHTTTGDIEITGYTVAP